MAKDSELVRNVKSESTIYIPPVILDSLEDFRLYAREAALVTYAPEYFRGPFIDDQKRLSRVTLVAIGVPVRGIPITFKYTLDYNDLYDPSRGWEEQTAEIDILLSQLITGLESGPPLVRGRIESEIPAGELLALRP